jgi:hypothetical protein
MSATERVGAFLNRVAMGFAGGSDECPIDPLYPSYEDRFTESIVAA